MDTNQVGSGVTRSHVLVPNVLKKINMKKKSGQLCSTANNLLMNSTAFPLEAGARQGLTHSVFFLFFSSTCFRNGIKAQTCKLWHQVTPTFPVMSQVTVAMCHLLGGYSCLFSSDMRERANYGRRLGLFSIVMPSCGRHLPFLFWPCVRKKKCRTHMPALCGVFVYFMRFVCFFFNF